MHNRPQAILLAALIILPLLISGCKGRVEAPQAEAPEGIIMPTDDILGIPITEPAQTIATEPIPPTAAAPVVEKPPAVAPEAIARNKDIQRALAKAGFYSGRIEGVIGPKTKRAIEEFQKAKGLKVDGKVGPKTWAALKAYLTH